MRFGQVDAPPEDLEMRRDDEVQMVLDDAPSETEGNVVRENTFSCAHGQG